MDKELIITKEDLVNWLKRPPSNDDLDLIGFIATRLENFYKLEQKNKQFKEKIKRRDEFIKYQQQKIDKAIKYIKTSINNPQPFYKYLYGDVDGKVQNLEKLLQILGDKE